VTTNFFAGHPRWREEVSRIKNSSDAAGRSDGSCGEGDASSACRIAPGGSPKICAAERRGSCSSSRILGAAKALGSLPFFGGVTQDQESGGVERTPATFKASKGTKDECFYAVWFLYSTEFVAGIEDCDLRVYCCSMSSLSLNRKG
jgi:hypothetical protein